MMSINRNIVQKTGMFMLLCILLARNAFSAEFSINPALDSPEIDGFLNEQCWQKSDTGKSFMLFDSSQSKLPIKALDQTFFKLLYDENNLYVGVVCAEPDMDKIKCAGGRDGLLSREDSVEIFIEPPASEIEYTHFIINTKGEYYDAMKKREDKYDSSWNADCRIKVSKKSGSWTIEAALPLKELELFPDKLPELFLNITRNDCTDGKGTLSTWSYIPPTVKGFHETDSFSRMSFVKKSTSPKTISNYPNQRTAGIVLNPEFEQNKRKRTVPWRWKVGKSARWDSQRDVLSGMQTGMLGSQELSLLNIAGKNIELLSYIKNPSANGQVVFEFVDSSDKIRQMKVTLPGTENRFQLHSVSFQFPADTKEVKKVEIFTDKPGEFQIAFLQIVQPKLMRFVYQVPWFKTKQPNSAYFSSSLPEVGVSKQVTAPLSWITGQTFVNKTKWGNVYADDNGNPLDKNFVVCIDMPAGVKIKRLGGAYRAIGFPGQKEHTVKEIERQGKTFKQHRISLKWLSSRIYVTYLDGNLEPGKEKTGYSWLEWNSGKSPEEKIVFRGVDIPSVKAPKRFIAGLCLNHVVEATIIPEERERDIIAWKKMGLNEICFLKWIQWDSVPKTPKGDQFVKSLKKKGFWISAMTGGVGAHFNRGRDPDGIAYDKDSNPLKGWMCLSYRGDHYQKFHDNIKGIVEHGISWIIFDWEVYNYQENKLCFCKRCKEGFNTFLKNKYPEMEYVDPSTVVKNRGKYSKLHIAWEDYRNTLVEEWLRDSKRVIEETAKKTGAYSSPRPYLDLTVVSHAWDYPRMLKGPMDHIGIMRYAYESGVYAEPTVRNVGLAIKEDSKKFGSEKHVPLLSPGGRSGEMVYPRTGIKYQILEAMASGAAGFQLYYNESMDGAAYKYMAEAIRMIEPVEDIILDGEIEEVPGTNRSIRVVKFKHPKGIVYFVSEYSIGPIEIGLKETVKGKSQIVDLDTRKVIGTLKPGIDKFTVKLDKERARLLFIGNPDYLK